MEVSRLFGKAEAVGHSGGQSEPLTKEIFQSETFGFILLGTETLTLT